MGVLQVVANQAGAGKTCLIAGFIRRLNAGGRTAAFCKPFSPQPGPDPDVAYLASLLSQAPPGSPSAAVPGAFPMPAPSGIAPGSPEAQAVRDHVQSLAAAAVVLVEGPDLLTAEGAASSLPAELSHAIDSRMVLLVRWQPALDAASVERLTEGWRDRLDGVVFNHCPVYRVRELEQTVAVPMLDAGFPVWGIIPEDRAMLSVTVQQIADHLEGRWVQEPENVDAAVDHFIVGGNIMDSGPNYFGRYAAQGVITRAERPDIQLASLDFNTRCLILTGGGEPTEYVRVEAAKRGVPLLSVSADTLSAAEALNGILDVANARTAAKADRFALLMERRLDLAAVMTALG